MDVDQQTQLVLTVHTSSQSEELLSCFFGHQSLMWGQSSVRDGCILSVGLTSLPGLQDGERYVHT